jgi:hypothetical protein
MQNIEYSCDSGEDKGLPRRNGALPSGLPLPAGQTGLVAGAGPEFGNLEDEACAAITEPSFSTWITIKTKDGSFSEKTRRSNSGSRVPNHNCRKKEGPDRSL